MNAIDVRQALRPIDPARDAGMLGTDSRGAEPTAEIERLARLDERVYESIRKETAKNMGWRVTMLDAEVHTRRVNMARAAEAAAKKPAPIAPGDSLAIALDDAVAFINRFAMLPPHADVVVALWAAHTHVAERLYTTPRLAFLSPEPESGKTHTMGIVGQLCANVVSTMNASPAAIYRNLENGMMTLLVDEVDTIFNAKGKDGDNEDLRGLLNAGYKQGNFVIRCVGQDHETRQFPTFCPVALAGLGDLPDTIRSRAIHVYMKRRASNEIIEEYRSRRHDGEAVEIRGRLAALLEPLAERVGDAEPELPDGIVNRSREVWEPLIAIADAAGGDWPEKARTAARALIAATRKPIAVSLGVRLLGDIRTVFGDRPRVSTQELLDALHALDGAPWADIGEKGLDARYLARLVGKYENAEGQPIEPRTQRYDAGPRAKGYVRHDFEDAWLRFLPPAMDGRIAVTSVTEDDETGFVTDVTHPRIPGPEEGFF